VFKSVVSQVEFITVPLRLVGQDRQSTPPGYSPALARLQTDPPDEKAVPDYIAQLLGFKDHKAAGAERVHIVCLRTKQRPP
jgi:hypothetical protein